MSRSKLHKVKVFISLLYGYAMQEDIVMKDYSEFIILPKEEKREKEKKCRSSTGIIKG